MRGIINKIKMTLDTSNAKSFFKGNGLIVFLSLLTLIGMIFGTTFVNFINLSTIKRLDILFLSDFDSRIGQSGIYTFISSFSSSFIFWLFFIIASLSFAGPALIPMILVFRSCGLGLTAGYLYLIYGLKGVAFYILVMLPGMFISSIGFILLSAKSIKFSLKVMKKFLPHPGEEEIWDNMVIYLKRSLYILVILMGASLVDMLFINIFSKLFTF